MKAPIDSALVFATLRWLGHSLRLHQLRLRAQRRQRKALERDEAKTRLALKQLKQRVQREIDAHPEIAKGYHTDG